MSFHIIYHLYTTDIDREATPAPQQQQISAVEDIGPNFDRLWSYTCKATQTRNVSCLSWNKSNPVSIRLCTSHQNFQLNPIMF